MDGIALGIASGAIEAGYFVLLAAAYRRGDLSVVYPLARGTAPLIAVAIGVLILGERLGVAGSIGVVALLAGSCGSSGRGGSSPPRWPLRRGRAAPPLRSAVRKPL